MLADDARAADLRAPSGHLVEHVADLSPGRALDAGCGHGVEAIWLAARGWEVTAVDFSATALEHARAAAARVGPEVAARTTWAEADLGVWAPPPGAFDLVVCLHVHVEGSVAEMVQRLAAGVVPGGTLLLVGYRPVEDPTPGARPAAPGQTQVTVEDAVAALDPLAWDVRVAAERVRAHGPSGVDGIVRAVRRAGTRSDDLGDLWSAPSDPLLAQDLEGFGGALRDPWST